MTWYRVEGSTRDPDLSEGLAAAVADPLWALARQWQVGEFHGEDAASPILVEARVAASPLTTFASGSGGDAVGLRAGERPLEVLVEQEPVDDDLLLSLELGWVLLRALADAGLEPLRSRLRSEHPAELPPDDGLDPVGRAQLELVARRSIDGLSLVDAMADAGGVRAYLAGLGLPRPAAVAALPVLRSWQTTVDDFVRLPDSGSSWATAELDYQFRVSGPALQGRSGQTDPGETDLVASDYRGGQLDWYHFAAAGEAKPLEAKGERVVRSLTVLPAALQFPGLPAARFWEVEDRQVSLDHLVGGAEDLVRSVVGGFTAVYRDDWLRMPVRLPAGSVAQVLHLEVLDDYGERHRIPSAAALDGPDRVWRYFEIEGDSGPDAAAPGRRRAPVLVVAPALADTDQGPPVERVDFRRDELANLVWAVERRAVGSSGRMIDRQAAAPPVPEPVPVGDQWSYEAFRPVPEHWIPFVPVVDDRNGQISLRRGRMVATAPDIPVERLVPMGEILDRSQPMRVNEETIPDAGLRIDRRYQRTRGVDGRVHLWMGRRVRYGAARSGRRVVTDVLNKPSS